MTTESKSSVEAGGAGEPTMAGIEEERTVVVNNLPLADPKLTEQQIMETYSAFGSICKLTLHRSPDRQAAIVVFDRPEAADRAVSQPPPTHLGERVEVFRPAHPNDPNTPGKRLLKAATDGTAVVLAESYMLGTKGLTALQRLDERAGVSARLKTVDEQTHISETLRNAAGAVEVRAKELDARYHVTDTMVDTAAALHDRAMQNQYIAKGAQTATSALTTAWSWGKQTVDAAKDRVVRRSSAAPSVSNGGMTSPPPAASGEANPGLPTANEVQHADGDEQTYAAASVNRPAERNVEL